MKFFIGDRYLANQGYTRTHFSNPSNIQAFNLPYSYWDLRCGFPKPCRHLDTDRFLNGCSGAQSDYRESKTVIDPVSDNSLVFSHVSSETL